MKKSILLLCSIAAAAYADPAELSLEQALELASQYSPALQAERLQAEAAEKAVSAAGLWVNPILELEAEGVGGDLDPYRDAEYTLFLKQPFLRGGKRNAARRIAVEDVGIARQVGAERALDLRAQVQRAFIELLAQQEISRVRDEQLELGQAFVEVARRRLSSGAGSDLEVAQAELALEEIVLSQSCCLGDLAAARARLASLLGLPADQLPRLAGAYYAVEPMDELEVNSSHPTLVRYGAEANRIQAEAELAKAQDTADISVGAGYRFEAAEDINTFVFSVSMPINFVRRGRAEQAAGLLRVDAILAERDEVFRSLSQDLSILQELHKGAVSEAVLTRDKLIPKAEQAYELSRSGYEAGRFSWVELITAQQHLADIRVRYIEALLAVHRIEADLSMFRK